MKVVRTIAEARAAVEAYRERTIRGGGRPSIGFVPTMGYLHEGHLSLMKAARRDTEFVVLSVFVNPLQFGPSEDYERYPRDEARDLRMAEEAGVDLAFLPDVREMYPEPPKTRVIVSELSEPLCGRSRPGHFEGVATVVSKLFHIIQPDRAYFGLKDAQQVAVVERMVADLNIPVQIVACPTVREPDGLALSSRNVYLSPEERKQATVLYRALSRLDEWLAQGLTAPQELKRKLEEEIRTAPLADIDYVEVLEYPSLSPVKTPSVVDAGRIIAAVAVRFGKTRLIDNRILDFRTGEAATCSGR